MKNVLMLAILLGFGALVLSMTLSCKDKPSSTPTFANALQTLQPTPCGYPGNTCTPTDTPTLVPTATATATHTCIPGDTRTPCP